MERETKREREEERDSGTQIDQQTELTLMLIKEKGELTGCLPWIALHSLSVLVMQ